LGRAEGSGVEIDRYPESIGMSEKLARGYVENNNKAEFEIIAGERRFRAAELADLTDVPVIVRKMTDQQVIEAQHVENLQREDVSPAEEAESYKKLIDSKIHTVESLAERLGIKRSTLYLRLKLTKLSPAVRAEVDSGHVCLIRWRS
jgi:ParB family chromosome partitioning protein